MGKISPRKKTPVSRYGFPRKIKIVRPPVGRPREPYLLRPEVYEAFCEWSAKPTPLKEEKTNKQFAVKWGIRPETLTRWKRKQEFWTKVAEWRMEWARDKTSDVIHGLFKRASTRGEAAEVKLWMQVIEDWSEKVTPTAPNITVIGIRGLSPDILDKLKKSPEIVAETEPIQEAEIIKG